jgi:putative membrane protein
MHLRRTVLPALALGLAALAGHPAPAAAQQASTTGGPSSLVPADLEFVLKAADGGMAEVALGELAQGHAGSDAVKQFAQHMIEDHTKANQELMQIATQRYVQPPTQPSPAAQEVAKTMAAYSGPDFDAVYVAQQVGAHGVQLTLFEHAAEHAETPELREFAKKHAPTVQEHLEAAKELMGQVGKS